MEKPENFELTWIKDGAESLVKILTEANIQYRKGTPTMSDKKFDELEEQLRKLDPDNEYFETIGWKPTNGMKLDLPVKMGSMNKCRTIDEIKAWIKYKNIPANTLFVLTPKFDGCSLLVDESITPMVYTRGNGIQGQNVRYHYKEMRQPWTCRNLYSLGEAIILKSKFELFYKGTREEGKYKNARNMVASLFNVNEPDAAKLQDVHFLRYGIIVQNDSVIGLDKRQQLIIANEINPVSVPYRMALAEDFTEELMNLLYEQWSRNYEIDGIIIDVDDAQLRHELGTETNGNPAYARAYKGGWEQIKETTITKIDWQVGRTGKLTPVARVESVDLEGGTVTNVTLYNAAYIMANGLAEGVRITLKRSGGVIPKIVKVIDPIKVSTTFEWKALIYESLWKSSINPATTEWDETDTDLYLIIPNDEQHIQQLCYFFKTLGVENFGEPTIRKFYEAGYVNVGMIIAMTHRDMLAIEGVGQETAKYLFKEFMAIFDDCKGVSFARLADASCCFEGLGEKTIQLCVDSQIDNFGEIKGEGIGPKTTKAYLAGHSEFLQWCVRNNIKCPTPEHSRRVVRSSKCKDMIVCFTGFRDKNMEDLVVSNGGKVVTSISSKTTHLIVDSMESTSSKISKAMSLNIAIIQKDVFIQML